MRDKGNPAVTEPGCRGPFLRSCTALDLVDVFPAVPVPTLVLHRHDDSLAPVGHERWIADRIPGARLVEVPGIDHLPFVGDAEAVVSTIQAFLIGQSASVPQDRPLLTILAAGRRRGSAPSMSTSLDSEVWQDLTAAYDRDVDEHLARYGGRRAKPPENGTCATFEGPARAIRCAQGIVEAAARRGLSVRVGLHCGDCEVTEGHVGGAAVRAATRIAQLAASREILASSTVVDLVAGSGISFGPAREADIEALSSRRPLFPVVHHAGPASTHRGTVAEHNLLRRDGEYRTGPCLPGS